MTMHMRLTSIVLAFVVAFLVPNIIGAEEHDNAKLLAALSKTKITLVQGLEQAAAKSPEAPISAKFEMDDNGALSLSIYTAEKGVGVAADQNVLKELSGSPEAAAWKTETEVFKDVEHVSRSAQQLTLMALSPHSLLKIAKQAETDQPGILVSVTPVLKDQKPMFVVEVASQGKIVELNYDLMTGQKK
jgi:hypothetical protein